MRHMDKVESTVVTYGVGSILVWNIESPTKNVAAVAVEMAALASKQQLGDISITRYGLNFNSFYFDLVLARDVSAAEIKLIFGSSPATY